MRFSTTGPLAHDVWAFRKSINLLLIAAMLSISTPLTAGPRSELPHRKWVSELNRISQWRMSFHYKMDIRFRNDFNGMGEEKYRRIEASGTAILKRSGQDYEYQGGGETTYDLEYYSLGQMNDYMILDVEKGQGKAPIENEACFLSFNPDDLTYSFSIIPGSGEGVPSRSYRKSNITDTVIAEMAAAGKPVLFPEKLKAMFPDEMTWDDFGSSFGVEAFGMPLPFFGRTLAGSWTDPLGGVVSWILEPVDQDETQDNGFDIIPEMENWTHFHPPEAESGSRIESLWPEIMIKAREMTATDSGRNDLAAGIKIYLVKEMDKGRSGPMIETGDSLMEIDLGRIEEAQRNRYPRTEEDVSFALNAAKTEKPNQIDLKALTQAALLALFYGDTGDVKEKLINSVQSHPLLLDSVEIQAGTIIVKMLGRLEGTESREKIRVREQIEYTATQGKKDFDIRIYLNDILFE